MRTVCPGEQHTSPEHSVDIVALAARHGLGWYQITDKWREW
ncbi:hypothetical protein [Streptomyces justiciae]|nr:hypothetical protein [Streptomyces justiciae]MCW8383334.1 hypothetical protein [Streptomyces justiciae]